MIDNYEIRCRCMWWCGKECGFKHLKPNPPPMPDVKPPKDTPDGKISFEKFLFWFREFSEAILDTPTKEQWEIIKSKIDSL